MKEYNTSASNFNDVMSQLHDEITEHKTLIITAKPAKIGKWGLARLWRKWMSTTADYMAGNGIKMPLMITAEGKYFGKRKFNPNDAHELFTSKWLGMDKDGNRLSWAKNSHDGMRAATKGERVHAMRQHEQWCIEKAIILFTPRDSEYQELLDKENQ